MAGDSVVWAKTARGSSLKPKDLMMMPARVALALQADGVADGKVAKVLARVIAEIEDAYDEEEIPDKVQVVLERLWAEYTEVCGDAWWLRSEIIWHKCLSGGAWIYAKTQKGQGPHMLKDLARLDPSTVQLWNGKEWTQVVGWASNNNTEKKLELVLRSGERIGCTADHKWPTKRGLVKAHDLQPGDILNSCILPSDDNTPAWLTLDALWFAGIYLAEGSMSGQTIQISGHTKETGRWQRIVNLCEHYGAKARLYTNGNRQAIHIDQAQALHAVLSTIVGGKLAKGKHLTARVWNWSNAALRALVEGYLEGDGSQEQSGRIRLGFTRNYSLERDLRCLAARLGASLTLKPRQVKLGDRDFPSFLGEWRWTKTQHQNNKERTEIVEIRNSRARKFWDVSVSGDPHLFSLASGVLTHNSNPMPESCTDRPTSAHEKVFLLTKKPRYFYDADAVRTDASQWTMDRLQYSWKSKEYNPNGDAPHKGIHKDKRTYRNPTSANLRNVWKIPTHSFPGAHFATFPPALAKRCILAGTSAAGVCAGCGAPWVRQVRLDGYVEDPHETK